MNISAKTMHPTNVINCSYIRGLVDAKVPEGRHLDYKEALPDLGNKESKSEFLRDVSSFANAGGGDIVFGISEAREGGKPSGIPEEIIGVTESNFDPVKLQMEQVIHTGIEPRIATIRIQDVECNGNQVLVVRVGESWFKPHRVSFRASERWFYRANNGKLPMNYQQVKEAFLATSEIGARMRRFRDERLARIMAGDLLHTLESPHLIVYHFLPVQSFAAETEVDLSDYVHRRRIPPSGSGINGYSRPNLDGVALYNVGSSMDEWMLGYTQLFHSGSIEIVDGFTIHGAGDERIIDPIEIERVFTHVIQAASMTLRETGIASDVYLMVSIHNVDRFTLAEQQMALRRTPRRCDRKHLMFPEIRIDLAEDLLSQTRPLYDMFWQAFGAPASPNYKTEA